MKVQFDRVDRRWIGLFIIASFLLIHEGFAQTTILPLGNSITWGKSDQAAPLTGEHGFRDHLILDFLAGYSVQLVGPNGAPYNAYYRDGARIGEFLPDSTYDVTGVLDTYTPDLVLLHIGTNNVLGGQIVGPVGNAETALNELRSLLRTLLDHASTIDQIFLCKIIPKVPTGSFPGDNSRVIDYNSGITKIYYDLSLADQDRVTLVDMHSPFYVNQNTYYNSTLDAVHPNPQGYVEMARYYGNNIKDYLTPSQTDEFVRAPLPPGMILAGTNGWFAPDEIKLEDVGEGGAGAIYTDAVPSNWDNLAIWDSTRGLNSFSIKIHSNSSANADTLSGVGVLVAMDTTEVDSANGYMVFVRNQRIEVYDVRKGIGVDSRVAFEDIGINYSRGDVFTVVYNVDGDDNVFNVELNGTQTRLVHTSAGFGKKAEAYSGIIFRGGTGNRVLVDYALGKSLRKDLTEPGQINDLRIAASSTTTLTVQWTAVGDDANDPNTRAASYKLRYSTSPIDSANFSEAKIISDLDTPDVQGRTETKTITGLLSGVRYYFAVKVTDQWGNTSPLSNTPFGETLTIGETADDFDRADLGSDWDYDPVEYAIDTGADELQNLLDSGDWGSAAIFKRISNPLAVKLGWGQAASNSGGPSISNGGLVLFAEDSTADAEGYFLFIRPSRKLIYLFDIAWVGDIRVFTELDRIQYDVESLGTYPDADDTVAVVMDVTEDEFNQFDVYVHLGTAWQSASRYSLYDTRDIGNRHGNVEGKRYYSGVLLAQLSGLRDNQVASFRVTGEPSTASNIAAVSAQSFSGVVNEQLAQSDSLIVLVEDENGTALQDLPVFFRVNEGGGSVSAGQNMDNHIRFEAEWGQLEPVMAVYNDLFASRGEYILSDVKSSGAASYTFYVETAGTYYFWGRMNNVKYLGRYAVGFQLYDASSTLADITWHVLQSSGESNEWTWYQVKNGQSQEPFSIFLNQGVYTMRIRGAHKNIMMDKFLVAEGIGYQAGQTDPLEADGAVLTNGDGHAATALTLGPAADDPTTPAVNEGLNTVVARALATVDGVTFEATGTSAAANTLSQIPYDTTGTAGDSLELGVVVYDAFGNRYTHMDATVHFTLDAEDGSLTQSQDATDDLGEASTFLRLGASQSPYFVTARLGATGPTVEFGIEVVEGFVDSIRAQTASDNFYVGDVRPDYLEVMVMDNQGEPVQNTAVTFQLEVVGDNYVSDARVGRQPKFSDSNGIVRDTLWLGDTAGLLKIIAKSGPERVNVIDGDSVFYNAAAISGVWGTNQIIPVNGVSGDSIRVLVTQKRNLGQPAVGHPVTFRTKGHGFQFPGGSESIVKYTNVNGMASTYVVAGPIHDQYEKIVEVSSSDGFSDLDNSPYQNITLTAYSSASRLERLSSAELEGVVGQILEEPLKVKMVDAFGNPVTGQPVTFIRTSGDGEIVSGGSEITVYTDETTGEALVFYKLGSDAGLSNVVEARATNGIPGNDLEPVVFDMLARSSGAELIYAFTDTLIADAVAGKSKTIQVIVEDAEGNGVVGQEVKFSILEGNGVLDGTADSTKTIETGEGGIATVEWTMGTVAGASNILEANATTTNWMADTLDGAPIRFQAQPGPDVVSHSQSTIDATSPTYAVQDSICDITVVLMDGYGNVVPIKQLELVVTGGILNSLKQRFVTTNTSGQAVGELESLSAGLKVIKAVVDADTLDDFSQVVFLAGNAAKIEYVFGDGQTGNVGTALDDSLVVRITDTALNPVAFGPVTFSVVGPMGSLIDANGTLRSTMQVWSDNDGYAVAFLRVDPSPGVNIVSATAPGLQGSAVFQATGRTGAPATMFYTSGDFQEGTVGEDLPDPLVVTVIDQDGFPVYGVGILYDILDGTGSVVTAQPVATDMYGRASSKYRVHTQVGSGDYDLVRAHNQTLDLGPVMFSVFRKPGLARKMAYVSGNNQSRKVNETTQNSLVVRTTDVYGNAVSGVNVTYNVVSGVATLDRGQPVQSDANGEAGVKVNVGHVAGEIQVEAKSQLLEGSPVLFTVYADPALAEDLYIYSGDHQTGTVNRNLIDSLSVRVVDANDNPVPNARVYFYKSKGQGGIVDPAGSIVDNLSVFSDSRGIAAVMFRCGALAEEIEVKARWGTDEEVFSDLDVSGNPNNPVWTNKGNIQDVYYVQEGKELIFSLRTTPDGDGDRLWFEIGNLFPPSGARIDSSADNLWIFRWTPDYDQARDDPYPILIWVLDGRGGSDGKTIQVYVLNTNRLPQIQITAPRQDTTLAAGQTIAFYVDAVDPDGDMLQYSWYVDDVPVENNQAVFYHFIEKSFIGTRIVKVFVSDQSGFSDPDDGSYRWQLSVTTSIELMEFKAEFEPGKTLVNVHWATANERDNVGFDLYRSTRADGDYRKVNEKLITEPIGDGYQFTDYSVEAGRTYYYRLVAVDVLGNENEFGPIKVQVPVPDDFILYQNYPNPFNPVTSIRFEIPVRSKVTLTIYNIMGQDIVQLVDEERNAGYYTAEWDGKDRYGQEVPSGIYIYRFSTEKQTITHRMVKMR